MVLDDIQSPAIDTNIQNCSSGPGNTWKQRCANAILPCFHMMTKIIEVNAYTSHVYPRVNNFNRFARFNDEDAGVIGLVLMYHEFR
jgi:hypothetical protein